MAEVAGEQLQYLAFHHMFNPDDRRNPVLGNLQYRQDPDRTWAQLMTAAAQHERRIIEAREAMPSKDIPLAMTECHFAIPDRDRCDVLSTWAAGVAYARMLNLHQRHGDVLKIATAADFCGNRWQVNAIMIPTPIGKGKTFLMPVARVMSLYRHHVGKQFVDVTSAPDGLDVTASRSGDQYYLHVVNTNRTQSVRAVIQISGAQLEKGKVFEIAVDPEHEITRFRRDSLDPVEKPWDIGKPWEFPAASVSVVEVKA
jgi:alpha-N-arabinofuranosidase